MHQIVPASVKLFLFADKIVPGDTAFSAGTLISYSQKKVKTNELAVFLLAFTLWDLFRKNCISLEVRNSKKLFFIPVETLIISIQKDIPVLGDLENWLIRGIKGSDDDVKKLIYLLLDENQPWPHKRVIHIVLNESCDMGLGKINERESGTNKLLKGFSGNTDFEAANLPVSKIELEFDLTVQQWNQFLLSSSRIAGMLITACRGALNSRVTQND